MSIEPMTGETDRAGRPADGARTHHSPFLQGTAASNPMLSPSNVAAKTNSLLRTPTRSAKAIPISPSGGGVASELRCAPPMPPVKTSTPFATPVEKVRHPGLNRHQSAIFYVTMGGCHWWLRFSFQACQVNCHEQPVGLGRRTRISVDPDLKLNSNMFCGLHWLV